MVGVFQGDHVMVKAAGPLHRAARRAVVRTLLIGCVVAALPAAHAATAFVRGEALYRERILPPPGAVLVVTLEDVSRAGAPARELASARRVIASGPPYSWRLAYDPAIVQRSRPALRLALRARILDGDVLWMTTDTFVPALGTDASAPRTLLLRRVAAPTLPPVATAPAPQPPPPAPPTPVGPGPTLLGSWTLTHIGEAEMPTSPERPVAAAHLVFAADGRVTGSDGCNRIVGSYTGDASSLQFGQLAGTRMACLGLNGRDDAFNRALSQVTAWRVRGRSLELLASATTGGAPLLRFAPDGPK
jgi:putative lipoprotein